LPLALLTALFDGADAVRSVPLAGGVAVSADFVLGAPGAGLGVAALGGVLGVWGAEGSGLGTGAFADGAGVTGVVAAGGDVGVGACAADGVEGAVGVAAGGGVSTFGVLGGALGTGACTGGSGDVVTFAGGVGSNHPPISGTAMTAITARTSKTKTARNQPVAKMLRCPYSSCSSSSRKSSSSGRSGLNARSSLSARS
jgi:hypothetical protein